MNYRFYPLTPSRWKDFEKLFGANGACGGCWCMWWKLKRSEFNKQKGDKNKKAMKKIVDSKKAPGIIAYENKNPVGWIAFGPRDSYPVLDNSRVLKRIDEKPVWSITCFFIEKNHRRKGLSKLLIKAAADYAKKKGAEIIEAYPTETKKESPAAFVWTGLLPSFTDTGFNEEARRSPTRPIMRLYLK